MTRTSSTRSPRRGPQGWRRFAAPVIAGVVLTAAVAGGVAVQMGDGLPGFLSAESRVLRDRVYADAPELAPVYEARRYEPIWVEGGEVRPEAQTLISVIAAAGLDGLDPERYGLSALRQELIAARTGEAAALARFEMQASKAYVDYVVDLHTPGEEMVYTDPAAAPAPMTRLSVLQAAAAAPSLEAHLTAARRMNPIYEDMRRALAQHRARSGGGDATEKLLLVNLDRARALPADPGRRYIVVDTPSAMLWMYEDGRPVGSMKVIVGKRDDPTPLMAGVIRYALFNPYWNVPEDIIRDSIAPQVLAQGPGVIAARRLEVLSDWSPQARVLDPATVDWRAVASGQHYQRVRQIPGESNMMGKVKFMLPNELGIYLHDTPNKARFSQENRWFSAGCVRVEDSERLARWMFGKVPAVSRPDHRVDLPEPIPVYMTYFTALPGPEGVQVRRDVYGWDSRSTASRDVRERAA